MVLGPCVILGMNLGIEGMGMGSHLDINSVIRADGAPQTIEAMVKVVLL